jgi:hypothetical protein
MLRGKDYRHNTVVIAEKACNHFFSLATAPSALVYGQRKPPSDSSLRRDVTLDRPLTV